MASFNVNRGRRFVHFSAIQENGYRTLNEGETVEMSMKGSQGLSGSERIARQRELESPNVRRPLVAARGFYRRAR